VRVLLAISLFLLAGCSKHDPAANGAVANAEQDSVVKLAPGDEPATSDSAKEARAKAQDYFDLIVARKFGDAYKLWENNGAGTGGDAKAFAASFDPYEKYDPKVGDPTDVKRVGDMQYVKVLVTVDTVLKRGHLARKLAGGLSLRRPAPKGTAGAQGWQIWGVDLRRPH
jgi:hypothetical protein